MQNLVRLREERRLLEERCDGTTLVTGGERWSPVATVRLHGLALPETTRPGRVDLDILVPDLFGFGADASVVVFRTPVALADGSALPFHGVLDAETAAPHVPYLPALRSPHLDLIGRAHLCLLPEPGPPVRYRHLPLPELVDRMIDFLRAPLDQADADVAMCRRAWERTGEPWWLHRLAHTLAGLGRTQEALEVFTDGARRFPHRTEFGHHAARLAVPGGT